MRVFWLVVFVVVVVSSVIHVRRHHSGLRATVELPEPAVDGGYLTLSSGGALYFEGASAYAYRPSDFTIPVMCSIGVQPRLLNCRGQWLLVCSSGSSCFVCEERDGGSFSVCTDGGAP